MFAYLIRIRDRPFGFRVVVVIAQDEDDALERCNHTYRSQWTDRTKEFFAEIEDSCSVKELGNSATFTFEE